MKILLSLIGSSSLFSSTIPQVVNTTTETMKVETYAKSYDYRIGKADELVVRREGSQGDLSDSSEGTVLKGLDQHKAVDYDRLLDEEWTMYANGAFVQHTKKTDRVNDRLEMEIISMNNDEIKLHYRDELQDTEGWAKQKSWIEVNLTIKSTGEMEYTNYVYAGSWGAVSMALTISRLTAFILVI